MIQSDQFYAFFINIPEILKIQFPSNPLIHFLSKIHINFNKDKVLSLILAIQCYPLYPIQSIHFNPYWSLNRSWSFYSLWSLLISANPFLIPFNPFWSANTFYYHESFYPNWFLIDTLPPIHFRPPIIPVTKNSSHLLLFYPLLIFFIITHTLIPQFLELFYALCIFQIRFPVNLT